MEKMQCEWQTGNKLTENLLEKIDIEYEWIDKKEDYKITIKDKPGFKATNAPKKPAIYRWIFIYKKRAKVLYVGQVSNLQMAFSSQYNNFDLTQDTRARLVAILWTLFHKKRGEWNFQILKLKKIANQSVKNDPLKTKKYREKLEKLFIQFYSPPLNR